MLIFFLNRKGYRKRVREREGKRNEMESARSTQFGEESFNGPSNRGRVGLTLKFNRRS